MFEILFLKWENLADAHIVFWILTVQSDTLPVVGYLGSDYLGVGEVLQYFHIYLGSEHYFWFKISEK